MIYNPYFEQQRIDAVVMPMGVKAADYPHSSRACGRSPTSGARSSRCRTR
jgi:shikimate dehydrogenase